MKYESRLLLTSSADLLLKNLDGTDIRKSERIEAKQEYESLRAKIQDIQSTTAGALETPMRVRTLILQTEDPSKYSREQREATWAQLHPNDAKPAASKPDPTPATDWRHPQFKARQMLCPAGRVLTAAPGGRDGAAKERGRVAVHIARACQGGDGGRCGGQVPGHLAHRNRLAPHLAVPAHQGQASIVPRNRTRTHTRDAAGKVFRIALPQEIHPDRASAQRSQTTGHLLLRLPRVQPAHSPDPSQEATDTLHSAQRKDTTKAKEVHAGAQNKSERANTVQPSWPSQAPAEGKAGKKEEHTKPAEETIPDDMPPLDEVYT